MRRRPPQARPPLSPLLLRTFVDLYEEVLFVEIGANDGQTLDPLAAHLGRPGWRGVMVEPVPHVFERLEAAHGSNPAIALEQAAIAATDGRREIHHLEAGAEDPRLPPWKDLIASFDRAHVLAQISAVGESRAAQLVQCTEVETLRFETLCARHGLEHIDLLMVDAEGADWEIVGSIDLERFRPRLLIFEHEHLDEAAKSESWSRLGSAGYLMYREGLDTWCMDTVPSDRLSARWRALLPGRGEQAVEP